MIIYTDLITGDEICSDSYPTTEVYNGLMLRLEGKRVTESSGGENYNIGANPSAEDGGDEGAVMPDTKTGINIVFAHRLMEVFFDKKDFKVSVKEWVARLHKKLEESNPERAAFFKENVLTPVKDILKDFGEYQFFVGENVDTDGSPVLVKYENEEPVMYVFKDGLVANKY